MITLRCGPKPEIPALSSAWHLATKPVQFALNHSHLPRRWCLLTLKTPIRGARGVNRPYTCYYFLGFPAAEKMSLLYDTSETYGDVRWLNKSHATTGAHLCLNLGRYWQQQHQQLRKQSNDEKQTWVASTHKTIRRGSIKSLRNCKSSRTSVHNVATGKWRYVWMNYSRLVMVCAEVNNHSRKSLAEI